MAGVREAMGEKYNGVTNLCRHGWICGIGLYYYFFNSWKFIGRRMLKSILKAGYSMEENIIYRPQNIELYMIPVLKSLVNTCTCNFDFSFIESY